METWGAADQIMSTVMKGTWLSALLHNGHSLITLVFGAVSAACLVVIGRRIGGKRTSIVPESVNYHMTRRCNYSCGFCYHTAKTSSELPIDQAKRGLRMLQDAGRYTVLP
jgi:hypothetical protein